MIRKNILVFVFCGLTSLGGCSKHGSIYLTGDSGTIYAEVYLDNNLVGTMQKYVPNGEPLHARNNASPKFLTPFASMTITAANGVHTVRIVGKDGRVLITRVELSGEAYLSVDFREMTISHQ